MVQYLIKIKMISNVVKQINKTDECWASPSPKYLYTSTATLQSSYTYKVHPQNHRSQQRPDTHTAHTQHHLYVKQTNCSHSIHIYIYIYDVCDNNPQADRFDQWTPHTMRSTTKFPHIEMSKHPSDTDLYNSNKIYIYMNKAHSNEFNKNNIAL